MWVLISSLYFIFLVIGTLMVLSSSSWFVVWVGLEVNMMSFIPLIGAKSSMSSEAVFKYFLVQVVASLLIFIFCLMKSVYSSGGFFYVDFFGGGEVLIVLLSMKLGASPLHFWFPSVMEGLDWFGVMLLMTWQKIAPLGLIIVVDCGFLVIMVVGLLSALVGSLGGLNQLLLRKVMAYSSISHLGWMCVVFELAEWGGMIYFFSYIIISLAIVICFMFSSYSHISQIYSSGSGVLGMVGGFFLGLFSLGGLPPLFGFFAKWVGISVILSAGYYWLVILFVFVGLFTLYFYLRIGYVGLMSSDGVGLWLSGGVSFVFSGLFLCGLSYFLLPFSLIGLM